MKHFSAIQLKDIGMNDTRTQSRPLFSVFRYVCKNRKQCIVKMLVFMTHGNNLGEVPHATLVGVE